MRSPEPRRTFDDATRIANLAGLARIVASNGVELGGKPAADALFPGLEEFAGRIAEAHEGTVR